VVGPARDLFERAQIAVLPGFDSDAHDYSRDVYDRLLRISEQIDSYRDVLTSAMDVYLSSNSNRLNLVMQRLTLIATVFPAHLRDRGLRPELRLAGGTHQRPRQLPDPRGWAGWPCPRS
jgi:hypothetical protein